MTYIGKGVFKISNEKHKNLNPEKIQKFEKTNIKKVISAMGYCFIISGKLIYIHQKIRLFFQLEKIMKEI